MFKRIRQTALLAALAAAVALPASAGVPEGVALLNKQDYKAAMKEFEAEAAKDNAEAMYYIGDWEQNPMLEKYLAGEIDYFLLPGNDGVNLAALAVEVVCNATLF